MRTVFRFGRFAAALLVAACASSAGTQPPRSSDTATPRDADDVVRVVDEMFAAMKSHDAMTLRRVLLEGAVIVHVGEQPDGSVRHAMVSDTAFIEKTAASTHALEERFTATPHVRIDGSIATLWGPYALWVDGERHHCGVDAVQLVRVDGRWRVSAITYTARPCG